MEVLHQEQALRGTNTVGHHLMLSAGSSWLVPGLLFRKGTPIGRVASAAFGLSIHGYFRSKGNTGDIP